MLQGYSFDINKQYLLQYEFDIECLYNFNKLLTY